MIWQITRDTARNTAVLLHVTVSFVWPEHLAPVAFAVTRDRITATWSTPPDHGDLWLVRRSLLKHAVEVTESGTTFVLTIVRHKLAMTAAFRGSVGATGAVLDFHAVPGFAHERQHDPNEWHNRELYLDDPDADSNPASPAPPCRCRCNRGAIARPSRRGQRARSAINEATQQASLVVPGRVAVAS